MTPKELMDRMSALDDEYKHDEEIRHFKADELMCEALEDAGFGGGVEIFRSMERWYA